MTMQEAIQFVNDRMAYHQDRLRRYSADPPHLREIHENLIKGYKDLIDTLEATQAIIDSTDSLSQLPLPITSDSLGDISDLPEEVLKELSAFQGDGKEFEIIEIIRDRGGTATLDQIIVDSYRKSQTAYKRRILGNKIYRMVKKGLLKPAGKKAVYSLP